MRVEYPDFVNNIQEVLRWFDVYLREKKGQKLPSNKFGYLGSRIKNFIKKENLTIDEFKILLWGVLNEKTNVFSPVYCFYFLDKLPEYKESLRKVNNKKDNNKEVEFDKESVIEDNNNNEMGDDFFEEL